MPSPHPPTLPRLQSTLPKPIAQPLLTPDSSTLPHSNRDPSHSDPPPARPPRYGFALGHTAAALIAAGLNGYLASVHGLSGPVSQWTGGGTPLTAMLSCKRHVDGSLTPQAKSAHVDLNGRPFAVLRESLEERWEASEE